MDPLGRYQPSNAERLHAAKLFKLAEALLHSDRGYLTEWQLSAFLQLSGVPAAELDAVWGLSVPSGSQTMAQAEFAVAMRLVAMAQAGQPVAWHALEAQAAQALDTGGERSRDVLIGRVQYYRVYRAHLSRWARGRDRAARRPQEEVRAVPSHELGGCTRTEPRATTWAAAAAAGTGRC